MLRSRILLALPLLVFPLTAQETHDHGVPEKLGAVSFPVSCLPSVQKEFNRGVALLHSFAYAAAESSFRKVAESDGHCAMAHWGIAMTHFHQIWDPPLPPAGIPVGQKELQDAQALSTKSDRERTLIDALAVIFKTDSGVAYRDRALQYEGAVCGLAAKERKDTEAQVFCALSLISNSSPLDKTHGKQKRAADMLEPLFRTYPQHPGIPHYLIHAYDSAELAPRGLAAAKVYAQIAPSAPHALHMPSHIFTRLGMWDDSIASNLAAQKAAREGGDIGEELHAMDYLVYANLQASRDAQAAAVIAQLYEMSSLKLADFKVAYAATAMPVRYAVERNQWDDAAKIQTPEGAPPHVAALAVWARGVGFARTGHVTEAQAESANLQPLADQLQQSKNAYWAEQTAILVLEVKAWTAQANSNAKAAVELLRGAADREDATEKLPVTPGPVLPAREQLGYLLLEQHQPANALAEFKAALTLAPGRRQSLQGVELCQR